MQKVILITGASSGIGKETAKLLAKEGYKIYAVARRIELMKDLESIDVVCMKMDVTDRKNTKNVVNQILNKEGRIDVLINNAGFGLYGPVEDVPIEDAQYQFEVNLFGLAYLTQLVLPHMRTRHSGKIINISSMVGKVYLPFGAWYQATKHALEGWSDCLRIETKPFNIQVILIEPGAIKTEFGEVVIKQLMKYYDNSAYKKQMAPLVEMRNNPKIMKRATHPKIIAEIILEAMKAKKPRRRYVKGFLAKPLMFIRKYFGDAVYEFILSKMFR